MKKIMLMALLSSLFVGCASKKAAVSVAGEWKISKVQEKTMTATEDIPLPTLSFADGNYHMYCGCNQINGKYSVDADKVKFEAGMSTKMYCPDVAELEDQLCGLLQGTYTLLSDDIGVALKNAEGATVLALVK